MAGATFRYWRLFVTAVDGSTTAASISEITLAATFGGTDLTTGLGGSTAQSGDSSVGGAAAAVSNSTGDEAGSSQPLPWWWRIDLGSPQYVEFITISSQRVVPNRSPHTFEIQGSNDDSTWQIVSLFAGVTGWGDQETRAFTLDYVAFSITGTVLDDTGSGAVRSLRFYRRDTGASLGATTSASDGTYSFATAYTGEIQAICLDDSSGTVHNDLLLRTTAA